MKNIEVDVLPGGKPVSRRFVINGLVSAGAGILAAPFLSPSAIAAATGGARDSSMVAEIFFDSYATIAYRRALRYAGDDGFVASLPQLLHARVGAGYDNVIWKTWFTANSEENVVTTPQGNHVVVTVHGGGIFDDPERFERSLRADLGRSNTEGLTGQYAAKLSATEAHEILDGRLPDGSQFPVYAFDEFKKGIAMLPRRYGVVLDFAAAKTSASGYVSFDELQNDPVLIIRAGGAAPLAAYLAKARMRNDTRLTGTWHSFARIDPAQPQSRLLTLSGNEDGKGSEGNDPGLGWGYDADDGISTTWPAGLARYVAVAPRDDTSDLRHLDFEP